ncbi:SIK2 [Symbiodinium sp. CCMP2592]|nr:SIK2 [Symbiodinium sp. CCMP2592]
MMVHAFIDEIRMLGQDSEVPSALVVFDWAAAFGPVSLLLPLQTTLAEDDTILPTAALVAAKRIAPAPQADTGPAPGHPGEAATSGARASGLLSDWDFDSYLEACAVAALQALQKAKQFGRVVIITNSGFGWVHETAVRFMPLLLSELEDIPVISARSIFEPLGVQEPYRWKVLCFRRIVDCFTFDASGKTGPSCLISIGDGWQERVAAMIAGQDVEACVKCIKFLEQPGVDQLAQELDLCSQVFEGLCGHPSWVDACYSYSKTWGLQLEARADDTSALGGSFAAVEGTVEVVSTDTVEDAGMDHVGPNTTEAEAPVGTPKDGAPSDGMAQPEPPQEPAVLSPSRKRARRSRCRSSKATLLARAGKEQALPWHRQYLTMSVHKKVASAASRRLWFQARKKFCKVRSRNPGRVPAVNYNGAVP